MVCSQAFGLFLGELRRYAHTPSRQRPQLFGFALTPAFEALLVEPGAVCWALTVQGLTQSHISAPDQDVVRVAQLSPGFAWPPGAGLCLGGNLDRPDSILVGFTTPLGGKDDYVEPPFLDHVVCFLLCWVCFVFPAFEVLGV